ncbi:sedoheptulose 7-phosphate cyclase [Photorhabdus asymbiotica]|uniref:sedoheptulose 7-phosphate cyclase n=1 Tax=Photorhabdus asymbiotica TaxID=291112 RepID=UPI003DA752E9
MKNPELLNQKSVINTSINWAMLSELKVNFTVEIINGIFEHQNHKLCNLCRNEKTGKARTLIFIDKVVDNIYSRTIKSYFNAHKIDFEWVTIDGNEESKNIESVLTVATNISQAGLLRRSEKIIAIGGGVVMDIVGFTANLHRRGIPYIRIPTTLMGQIDAGIGVKTGINYMGHKNRLGTYYAPVTALIDPIFLRSVSQRHITNGVAEIIKMALIKDYQLFETLEKIVDQLTPESFASFSPLHKEIIVRSIDGMLEELEPNLWEDNLERIVDYGHTFSPSLELLSSPPLLHGEAVAVDMALCIGISYARGLISKTIADRSIRLIQNCNLPIQHPIFTPSLLEDALNDSIKHRDGLQRVPLMNGIGSAIFCNDISRQNLEEALEYVSEYSEYEYKL